MKCEHHSGSCWVTETMATEQDNGNIKMNSPLTTTILKGIDKKCNKFLPKWKKKKMSGYMCMDM